MGIKIKRAPQVLIQEPVGLVLLGRLFIKSTVKTAFKDESAYGLPHAVRGTPKIGILGPSVFTTYSHIPA